jgi:hypothetical protein
LVSVSPNAGFVSEIEDESSSRIRVRSRSDVDDSQIEVRACDGRVEPDVS